MSATEGQPLREQCARWASKLNFSACRRNAAKNRMCTLQELYCSERERPTRQKASTSNVNSYNEKAAMPLLRLSYGRFSQTREKLAPQPSITSLVLRELAIPVRERITTILSSLLGQSFIIVFEIIWLYYNYRKKFPKHVIKLCDPQVIVINILWSRDLVTICIMEILGF